MTGTEIAFIIDWSIWLPIVISAISLLLTIRSMRRHASRDRMADVEKKIEKAANALKECEDNLKQCGREKDELRREKYALLERVASVTVGSDKSSS